MDICYCSFIRPFAAAFIKSSDPDSMIFDKTFKIIFIRVPFKGMFRGVILNVSINEKTDMIQLI